jgi:hypothetical protein
MKAAPSMIVVVDIHSVGLYSYLSVVAGNVELLCFWFCIIISVWDLVSFITLVSDCTTDKQSVSCGKSGYNVDFLEFNKNSNHLGPM